MKVFCEYLKEILRLFTQIATAEMFAAAIYIQFFWKNESVDAVSILRQILVSSALCAVGCILVMTGNNRELCKKEMMLRRILYYIYVNAVILICGYLFKWYLPSDWKMVVGMVFAIAAVYVVVSVLSYHIQVKTAQEINERLKERNGDLIKM